MDFVVNYRHVFDTFESVEYDDKEETIRFTGFESTLFRVKIGNLCLTFCRLMFKK